MSCRTTCSILDHIFWRQTKPRGSQPCSSMDTFSRSSLPPHSGHDDTLTATACRMALILAAV
ncbi:hypothetical protein DICSQDRAFT_134497 [Dichomitus squalens LYAD-421 SS1]|uniref:uncharacterized protein n=1 Tax=Dichomitus squalens (strain LYAD-421) TaxID=732165 RepID=UPI0004415195|nr:uncharacterized protein DICSQDRAFT_134497 [Dichomitus squalens LYAD-421 SS1]EJF63896.1 hypothetical protein DICSQDRAFT_134497 [Dichomitus squalens LYAD-421 SS1]